MIKYFFFWLLIMVTGILVGLAICTPLHAAEYCGGVVLASDHHTETRNINEQHEGIYGSREGWFLGYMPANSYGRPSWYGGREFELARWDQLRLKWSVGIGSGYQDTADFGDEYVALLAVSVGVGPAKYWHAGKLSFYGLEVCNGH